jgi:hypothetical protein
VEEEEEKGLHGVHVFKQLRRNKRTPADKRKLQLALTVTFHRRDHQTWRPSG